MKKRSWIILLIFFAGGWLLTTILFGAYFVLRASCPAARAFFNASGLDTNAITAYPCGGVGEIVSASVAFFEFLQIL